MSNKSISETTRDVLRDLAAMSVGAAAGIILYKILKGRRQRCGTAPTSLIDSITCYEEGSLCSIISFGWDQDEMFAWARETYLDADGETERESLLETEKYEGKMLLVRTNCHDDSGTPEMSTIDLDPFGMGTSVSLRRPSGKDEHWDLTLDGGQLLSLSTHGLDLKASWDTAGNLTSIRDSDGEYSLEMTYYSRLANRIFPDLNYLYQGLTPDFLAGFTLGVRSSDLLSSMEIRHADYRYHLLASYLCDAYDRPVQVRHEVTEIEGGEATELTRRYEIKYL